MEGVEEGPWLAEIMVIDSHLSTVHYITLQCITGDGAGGQGGPTGCHLHAARLQGGRQVLIIYLSSLYFSECQGKIV